MKFPIRRALGFVLSATPLASLSAGTLTVSNATTSGSTVVNSGAVMVTNTSSSSTGAVSVLTAANGGTLTLSGASYNGGSTAALAVANNNLSLSAGTVNLTTASNAGNLTVSGATLSTGSVNSGTLVLNSGTNTGTSLTTATGGTLIISGNPYLGTINLGNGSGLIINNGGLNYVGNVLSGASVPYVLKVPDMGNVQSVEFILASLSEHGTAPLAGLVAGPDGAFYGTASTGGTSGYGTVFRVSATGAVTTLVDFLNPAFTSSNYIVGATPTAKLTLGADGNFYGSTDQGGLYNKGTLFKVSPSGAGYTVLASFNGKNGAGPVSSLTLGRDGNFYGTTEKGGPYASSAGTVFKVTPAGALTTLANFDVKNGRTPAGGLLLNTDGNFYGTTVSGGASAAGTVFKVTPTGELTTVISFDHKNGAYPGDGVTRGKDGNLYGTTGVDGTRNQGTIFRLNRAGVLATLATFTGDNGADPVGGLTVDADGNLFGTTDSGGTADQGTAFRITPTGVLTRLVSFTGANGAHPQAGLLLAANGEFYGTTSLGGFSDKGAIFALALPKPQAITFPRIAPVKVGQSVTLAATATSGLPVSYRVVSGPATISSGSSTVVFTGAGKVVLAATQVGSLKFGAASEVQIEVTVQKSAQTISNFAVIADRAYSPIPFTFALPTATSGLPVFVTVKSGHSTISGNTLTLTGVGEVTLTANQPGNDNFFAAKPVTTSFVVKKATQTITLPEVPLLAVGQSVTLRGTASSGLAVTYTVAGPATISGNTLKVTGHGQIILKAHQEGNANYLPAPIVTQVLKVPVPVVTTGTVGTTGSVTYTIGGSLNLGGSYTYGASVTSNAGYYNSGGTLILSGSTAYNGTTSVIGSTLSGGTFGTITIAGTSVEITGTTGTFHFTGTVATLDLGTSSVVPSTGIVTVVTTTTGTVTFFVSPQTAQ